MISKEEFDRIDEEYAKRQLKSAEEHFGSLRPIYVRGDFVPTDSPLPILKKIESLIKPYKNTFKNIIIPSTDNPDPNSWLQNFIQDDMKPETKDKILFKFGEFVGTLSKEEKLSYNQIIGVLLDFIEQNPK